MRFIYFVVIVWHYGKMQFGTLGSALGLIANPFCRMNDLRNVVLYLRKNFVSDRDFRFFVFRQISKPGLLSQSEKVLALHLNFPIVACNQFFYILISNILISKKLSFSEILLVQAIYTSAKNVLCLNVLQFQKFKYKS